MSYQGVEKRQYLRVDYERPIEFEICSDSQVADMPAGVSKNVSSCGVLLVSRSLMDVGTIVSLDLDPHTLSDIVEIVDSVVQVAGKIMGRIVRVEEIIPEKEYAFGICFFREQELMEEDEQVHKVMEAMAL